MAKQNPDLFLIKIGDDADPVEFSTLCGLNSRTLTIGGDEIDVSSVSCGDITGNAWQEVAHGLRKVMTSGSGFFESKDQTERLIIAKLEGDGKAPMQIIVPGLGAFEGVFLIGDLGISAELNGGAVKQEIALSSASPVTFTAEA